MESLAHVWHDRVRRTPDALAFLHRQDGGWRRLTWRESDARVRAVALGLAALGVRRGDRVAILSGTRIEWIFADVGILCAGAATTTIYPSSTPDECAWILGDSGAVACFVEDREQLAKVLAVRDRLPDLKHVVVFDRAVRGEEEGTPRILSLAELEAHGAGGAEAFRALADGLGGDDLATLIYTSGTTGRPKGVMLSHEGWLYEAEAAELQTHAMRQDGDVQYLFLPLAHAFGKVLELVAIHIGVPTAVDGDLDRLLDGMQEIRPTFMGAVPRVFEKAHARIVNTAQAAGGWRYEVFRRAVGVGERYVDAVLAGEEPGRRLTLKYRIARRLVFRRVREAFGGRVRGFVSGGAPLSPEIARFFFAADIRILEGYGLTETSAGAVANLWDDLRFGTVGRPFPGTEIRIASDGEILIRGRNVMQGYWNAPDATAEVLDADGWFHSGDLGELDDEGYLRITGRKKDILITAGGKNIAPQPIENRIKATSPYISEIVMLGDRRPYCVALVCIDEEAVSGWAADEGIHASGYAELATDPRVHDLIWKEVQRVNAELPSYSTIKKVHLVDHELSQERGELTPSLKVKRRVVEAHYERVLEALYSEARRGAGHG